MHPRFCFEAWDSKPPPSQDALVGPFIHWHRTKAWDNIPGDGPMQHHTHTSLHVHRHHIHTFIYLHLFTAVTVDSADRIQMQNYQYACSQYDRVAVSPVIKWFLPSCGEREIWKRKVVQKKHFSVSWFYAETCVSQIFQYIANTLLMAFPLTLKTKLKG